MGQFACIVCIASILSLCCVVSSMYIDRTTNPSEDNDSSATTSNVMKVYGKRRYLDNKDNEAALDEVRSIIDEVQNSQRVKKQSQLTFIIKPGKAPQQNELTTIPSNHSNDPGVIYIQVPAYVNHSYSLFLHPSKNSTKNNNDNNNNNPTEISEGNEINGSSNDVADRPENLDGVDNPNKEMDKTDDLEDAEDTTISTDNTITDQENDDQDIHGENEQNPTEGTEGYENYTENEEQNPENDSEVTQNENEMNMETPDHENEDSNNRDEAETEDSHTTSENTTGNHEANDESESANEQNVESSNRSNENNDGTNNQDTTAGTNENIDTNDKDDGVSPTTEEGVTESDDCDEDIDESQDFPETNEESPSVAENETSDDKPNSETDNFNIDNDLNNQNESNDIDHDQIEQSVMDHQNGNEDQYDNDGSMVNAEEQGLQDEMETMITTEKLDNPATMTQLDETNVVENHNYEENTELDNQSENNYQDSNAEASNTNEHVSDSGNQINEPENVGNEGNDINENDDQQDLSDNMNENNNNDDGQDIHQTENGQTEYDDDAQNALDQNEPVASTPKPGSQITNLKDACLDLRGQFASPNSCRKYVNCWDGIPVERDCLPGLFFNEAKGYCDWSYLVDCGNRPIIDTPSIQGCDQNPHGAFRNPENCSEYYVCVTQEPVKFKCPEGLSYNEILGVCDHTYRVNCGSSSLSSSTANIQTRRVSPGLVMTNTFCKPDYLWRVGRGCGRVDICSSEGRVLQVRCPTLTSYDAKARKCIYEGVARC